MRSKFIISILLILVLIGSLFSIGAVDSSPPEEVDIGPVAMIAEAVSVEVFPVMIMPEAVDKTIIEMSTGSLAETQLLENEMIVPTVLLILITIVVSAVLYVMRNRIVLLVHTPVRFPLKHPMTA